MNMRPAPASEPETGAKYWRSLDHLAETPEFRAWAEREFPEGASELADPVSRRHFVKIMSASFMLAGVGLTGCRRPVERILPFSKMPEDYIHGVPQWYATAMPTRSGALPLIARADDGRPTKVEGNPLYPDRVGTDCFAQASVLNVYDPDRAQRFARRGGNVSRSEAFDQLHQLATSAAANGGEGLAFLLERSSSPSRRRLQTAMAERLPKARWFVHEPVDFHIHEAAAARAFGKAVAPRHRIDRAKVILALDCDFIGSEENPHRAIRDFTGGRRIRQPDDAINRLYAVEGLMTLTGASADHRLRLAPSSIIQVAGAIASEVLSQTGAGSGEFKAALARLGAPAGVPAAWIRECAKDLAANRGQSLVLAGYAQPLAVHVIAQALNAALGNVGRTVVFDEVPAPGEGTISQLAETLNAGGVSTLVIVGGNPVYSAPAELNWAAAQRKAKTVLRLGYFEDESADPQWCDWHFPQAHYLESWGDALAAEGLLVAIQPLIEPLFGGISELEFLGRIFGLEQSTAYDIVRETFRATVGDAGFEERWKRFLHDGFVADRAVKTAEVDIDWVAATEALTGQTLPAAPTKDRLEVVFHRDAKVDDGRFANNGWLQELPDPITKVVWENVIRMSRKTAEELGLNFPVVRNNRSELPLVKVSLGGREITGPAWIQPGMADYVLGLALGYGRTKAGRVGNRAGYDAYRLRTAAAPYIAAGAQVADAGRLVPVSTTQSHGVMEGRPVVREATLKQYRDLPHFARAMDVETPPGPKDPAHPNLPKPMYPNPLDVPGKDGQTPRERAIHAWAMSIDLNACVGCSACVVACQSENNVPIVGKDQVGRNREMHWLRVDRYYAGKVEEPQVVNQPMMCQHCESAPCENVCPVAATSHSDEGLNLMVYNRCVGTRYCSNNCPYKVRRFNFLDYNRRPLDKLVGPFYSSPLVHSTDGEWDLLRWWRNPDTGIRPQEEWELLKLVKNPQVTVRMRGVMEKCTYCIQRIEQAKIAQKVKAGASGDIEVPDGTIKTACQQACPAEAIVFGNEKDPNSRVSQLKKMDRDYQVLESLNVKPRTTYLARVRNPNPAMPDAYEAPMSFVEWERAGNHLEAPGEGESKAAGAAESKGAL